MRTALVGQDIHCIGVNDRLTDLFEGQWPLPHGVSYNAYLVLGREPALIDTVKNAYGEDLVKALSSILPPENVRYIVVNHVEPDHSGALPLVCRLAPRATVLATPAALPLLEGFYGIKQRVRPVADGEVLDLGGKILSFHHVPFVHWPETMATYEQTEKVLFSCDALGGFGALNGVLFDDEAPLDFYEDEAVRYFVNIVGMHSKPTLRALDKLGKLDIRVIAPSHGLVWRKNPQRIVQLYMKLARMEGETGVTVAYGSMYDHTRQMADAAARGVVEGGLPVKLVDVARVHVSFSLAEVWKRRGLILVAPTYDGGLFYPMEHLLHVVTRKRLGGRVAGLIGSFGWHGRASAKMKETAEALGWKVAAELEYRGFPRLEDLEKAQELGRQVAQAVNGAGGGS